jgi:putative ABC transport system substrate-binding protein
MFNPMKLAVIHMVTAALIILALAPTVQAQDAKPARIGFLSRTTPAAPSIAAFHQGMRDRGHIEGRTYVLVPAWNKPGGKREKTAVLARKLVARGVDLIVTVGSRRAYHASRAAPSTPIVMASSADPVRAGLIKSLAAPGGNITGVSSAAVDAGVKRIEILKQLVPGLRRIAVIHWRATKMGSKLWSAVDKYTARVLDIEFITFNTINLDDFDALFRRVSGAGAGAITVRSTPAYSMAERRLLVQAALRAKLPSVLPRTQMVKMGGLLSLGSNRTWIYHRAAVYVDKILKGAKPADLPVERPAKFKLVINLKTAKTLGITIPPSILLRADEVIE